MQGPIGMPDPLEAARTRAALMRVVRYVFAALLFIVTLLAMIRIDRSAAGTTEVVLSLGWYLPLIAAVVLIAVVIAIDVLTPHKKISTISGVFLGLLAGMVATYALTFVIDLLAAVWEVRAPALVSTMKVLTGISLCYLGVSTVLHTQDDFRLVIPYVEFSKTLRGPRPLLLDSSVLIDARILQVAETGFLQAPVAVPRFVLAELQAMADAPDRVKRAKGRRGLDVVSKLQRAGTVDVTIDETQVPGMGADQMLVELARRMPATIVTSDSGLARVSQIQGVPILNLHELSDALRPTLAPGDSVTIRPVRPGEQPGQAVGYLDDGTMIVVEDAEHAIDREVRVDVVSALQTSAGRLVFARLADGEVRATAGVAGAAESADANAPEPAGPVVAPAKPVASVDGAGTDAGREASGGSTGGGGDAGARGRGPFPPKPPARSASPRNPRR
jgi:uncharacterized protein YacL